MTVDSLIKKLEGLDLSKLIIPQVIAEDGTVWNCCLDVHDIPNSTLVQLRISHPDLKTLPNSAEIK